MTYGARLRVTFPEGGAPPADDARKVLLNAAPVVEDEKRAVAAVVVVVVVGKPPLQLQDDEEVRDVMVPLDASSEVVAAATTADPSGRDALTEEWHRVAEHPSLNRVGMVCVRMMAARDHSRNEGVPPTMPKAPTKNYYCCHCCWRSG